MIYKLIDEFCLTTFLGKGSFGEVYLTSHKNINKQYATKQIPREIAESPLLHKYIMNEINILRTINHKNIIHLETVRKTNNNYYIITEYCNGGDLSTCLRKYMLKYGRAFSEEIVQYLMRQIVEAIKYLHGKRIIHRDIKLDNILVNFENEIDEVNLNLLKCQIKLIDFGLATYLNDSNVAYTALGTPIYMDPIILKKFNNILKYNFNDKSICYNEKADIYSLGTVCYEMIIGQKVFDGKDVYEIEKNIEDGNYHIPTNLSEEVVSFLNGMLQYEPQARLTAEQLYNHQFLQENIQNFHKIDLNQVSNRVKKNELEIDTKKNKSIWAIFNQDDENKLNKISPGHLAPINEVPENNFIPQQKTFNQDKNNMSNAQPIKNTNTYEANQLPSMMNNGYNYNTNYNNPYYGPMLPRGQQGFQNIPRNIYQNNGPAPTLSGQPMSETNYVCIANIYNQ